jgi:hypothetical protein
LYHSTDSDSALRIIKSDVILPETDAEINGRAVKGLSLTRSAWFSRAFNTVVFGFDLNNLREKFRGRIKPYADPRIGDIDDGATGDYRREAEEFLIGSLPLADSLTGIWISRVGPEDTHHPEISAALRQVERHPLFKGYVR